MKLEILLNLAKVRLVSKGGGFSGLSSTCVPTGLVPQNHRTTEPQSYLDTETKESTLYTTGYSLQGRVTMCNHACSCCIINEPDLFCVRVPALRVSGSCMKWPGHTLPWPEGHPGYHHRCRAISLYCCLTACSLSSAWDRCLGGPVNLYQ